MQFKSPDLERLENLGREARLTTDTIRKLRELFINSLWPETNVRSELVTLVPMLQTLESRWEGVSRMSLTPAGISIAATNIRRKTGQEFDLGIWINLNYAQL